MNNAKHNPWAECDRLKAENERLKAELEAARKVADAAVAYIRLDGSCAELGAAAWCELGDAAWCCLDDAVSEYRAANPPLSPEKRAVIDRTVDKTDEEWQEVCKCC